MTRYQVTTILLVIMQIVLIVAGIQILVTNFNGLALVYMLGVFALYSLLLFGHLRYRWPWISQAIGACVLMSTFAAIAIIPEVATFAGISFVPMVVAAVLLSPVWTLVTYGLTLAGLAVITFSTTGTLAGPAFSFGNLLLGVFIASGIAVANAIGWHAQRAAELSAQHAAEARERAEHKAAELEQANTQMNDQLEQQRQLLELVATLETPAVPLAAGVLLAPIVGHLDTRRAQALTTRLLHESSAQHARLVVLDIAGVPLIDTGVAKALLQTAQALRLLGCEVALSGITANVALTLTHLGVGLEGITTVRSPQEALALHLRAVAA